jgi:hypothetical protein
MTFERGILGPLVGRDALRKLWLNLWAGESAQEGSMTRRNRRIGLGRKSFEKTRGGMGRRRAVGVRT